MNTLPPNAALILVDVQQAFDDTSWGQRNNPEAEANIAVLLAGWRKTGRPVIHVHHRSARPDSLFYAENRGFKVKPEAEPISGEPIIHKDVNSSFIGTDLEQRLRGQDIGTLIICGITTDHCVSTTTRMAGNLGFEAYIISDATATFERIGPDGRHYTAEQMHDTALASVHKEFATVLDSVTMLSLL